MMNWVVTHYYPWKPYAPEFWAIAKSHNGEWAKRLGWGFAADSEQRVPKLYPHVKWPLSLYREKAAMIHETLCGLPDGDMALWLDGDALILRDPSGVFDELGAADVGMVKFIKERWNSGVVAMKVSEVTRQLWKEVIGHMHTKKEPFIDGPLHENICNEWTAHECASCPWQPGDRGPLCGSHKVKVAELGHQWNEHHDKIDDQTRIVGLHMTGSHTTLRVMKELTGVK